MSDFTMIKDAVGCIESILDPHVPISFSTDTRIRYHKYMYDAKFRKGGVYGPLLEDALVRIIESAPAKWTNHLQSSRTTTFFEARSNYYARCRLLKLMTRPLTNYDNERVNLIQNALADAWEFSPEGPNVWRFEADAADAKK
jgi:hypothetical protein